MNNRDAFVRWFEQATGHEPYPFQIRFACEPTLPQLVDVPTGMGKTAMAVLGWLWRRPNLKTM
ncbi:MAG: CRISPR-associated helicase Cas3 [Nitrospira sp.]|jgi:CRISPR-associated endonuclease/helicase Cas3|nr:MAG: CRISPR-associated helicase Cas3 [Nitrospira sp.]